MRSLPAIFFAAIAAFAQQNVTIKGVVTDAQTGTPVPGAKVELRYSTSRAAVDTAETGVPGTFELTVNQAGKYLVAAYGSGYRESVSEPATVTDTEFEPGAAAVNRKFELKLPRSSGIAGFLRDAETKEPVRRVPVRALRMIWLAGQRRINEEQLILTDDEGSFRIDSLPPGEYAIMFGNTTPVSAASSKKVYPIMLWPEGDNAPFLVKDGSNIDLGAIDYAKITPARFIGPDCEDHKQPVDVSISQNVGGGWFSLGKDSMPACGILSPLPAVSQGRYRLSFMRTLGDFRMGYEEIFIRRGEDAHVRIQLSAPISLTGTMTCDCEKALVIENPIGLEAYSMEFASKVNLTQVGPFPQPLIVGNDYHVSIGNLPPGLALKDLRIDGASIAIVLTDKPAKLTGTVDSKTALENHVVLAKWPLPQDSIYPEFRNAAVKEDGQFSLDAVPAGTYRVAAIGPVQWSLRGVPEVVAHWFTSGDEITLVENEIKVIRLEAKIP